MSTSTAWARNASANATDCGASGVCVADRDERWRITGRDMRGHRHLCHARVVWIARAQVGPQHGAHETSELPVEVHADRVIRTTIEYQPAERPSRQSSGNPQVLRVAFVGNNERRLRDDLRAG